MQPHKIDTVVIDHHGIGQASQTHGPTRLHHPDFFRPVLFKEHDSVLQLGILYNGNRRERKQIF